MEASDHAGVFQYLSDTHTISPFFQYHNRQVLGFSLSYLNRNSLTKTGLILAYEQWRFFKTIKKDFIKQRSHLSDITFKEYLSAQAFSTQFIDHMLLPALAVTLMGSSPSHPVIPSITASAMADNVTLDSFELASC